MRSVTVSPLTMFLLLCPLQGDNSRTVLSEYYEVHLSDIWSVPENVCKVLAEDVPGIFKSAGVLPEPRKHDMGEAVLLRWRGCIETCLWFLDEDARQANAIELPPMDTSDVMDFDEAEVVMAVDLGGSTVLSKFQQCPNIQERALCLQEMKIKTRFQEH
ncbi:hypothetical protein EV702DRAFT_1225176 [Suillus placidus]|uniref:Uncharacterized protein n=1 Tax=Suillus placidus TaxID=48579 RepID=A0A9P6ZVK8_9AGAM|nr:hypothetical protein EV702DRAFT_1225176 [Suillus placidus]